MTTDRPGSRPQPRRFFLQGFKALQGVTAPRRGGRHACCNTSLTRPPTGSCKAVIARQRQHAPARRVSTCAIALQVALRRHGCCRRKLQAERLNASPRRPWRPREPGWPRWCRRSSRNEHRVPMVQAGRDRVDHSRGPAVAGRLSDHVGAPQAPGRDGRHELLRAAADGPPHR